MIIGSNVGNETIKLFMFISSQHIPSQGLADHDIATTRHMLITHVYHCSLVIIQIIKGFTSHHLLSHHRLSTKNIYSSKV